MSVRCVALLSGGLDSMLAIRLMQRQGIKVEAVNFKTVFTCCQDQSARAARELGVRLHVISQDDDYLELVREPRFGRGKGANPCIDCRIYMFERAQRCLEQLDARFVISGEVIGQRPMSQKRRDLHVISRHSGLDDLLLRPLSAKLLPPTLPEREGWVDREKLHAFSGRRRVELIALAKELGIETIPAPSTGCALTERQFSKTVFDLIRQKPDGGRWDFELLNTGRHFRFDDATKIVVGRNEPENAALVYAHGLPDAAGTTLLEPQDFAGPTALLVGPPEEAALSFAAALMRRYGKNAAAAGAPVFVKAHLPGKEFRRVAAIVDSAAMAARTLASV